MAFIDFKPIPLESFDSLGLQNFSESLKRFNIDLIYRPGEELFFAYYRSKACWDRWQRLTGSLAGAAHLSHDNAGVLRSAQVGQKPTVEKKVKSRLKLQ